MDVSTGSASILRHIYPLTSIRFFAAIAVVFYHFWESFIPSTPCPQLFANGFIGVSFFYLLSGFILGHVYISGPNPEIQYRRFIISRFARIYPAYALSLVLELPIVIPLIISRPSHLKQLAIAIATLLVFIVLLQAWDKALQWHWNPASWSISVESFFYVIFPFCARWSARTRSFNRKTLELLFWSILMVLPSAIASHQGFSMDGPHSGWVVSMLVFSPIFRIPEFMIGLTLHSLQQDLKPKYSLLNSPRLANRLLYVGILFFAVAIYFSPYIPHMICYCGAFDLIFACIILALSRASNTITALLSHKFAILLGEASYAVYILQFPLFDLIYPFLKNLARGSTFNQTVALILFSIALVSLSVASFVYFETPVRLWLIKRLNRPAPETAACSA